MHVLTVRLLAAQSGSIGMETTGRDGGLESILKIRSLEVNCRAEGTSKSMDQQLSQVWRGSAWKRRRAVLQTVGTLTVDTIGSRCWPQIRG